MLTETYSPRAIDTAPATSPAIARGRDLRSDCRGGGDPDHQAGRGDDAVVGAEHSGAQPVQPGADRTTVGLLPVAAVEGDRLAR